MCLKKKLNIFLNCFNFLRLNTCPCFTNFILTKINFIRKFNAAPLHVALSIDIGNRLLNTTSRTYDKSVWERICLIFQRRWVSIVSYCLMHLRRSIVCKTPGNPYHRLLYLSGLGVVMMTQSTGALWWEDKDQKWSLTQRGTTPSPPHPLTEIFWGVAHC